MKATKLIYFIALVAMYSCTKSPKAHFTYSSSIPVAGEAVYFINRSEEAKSYSWNFGDMSISDDENPIHVYQSAGVYKVELTASRGLKSSSKTLTLYVQE